MLSPEELLKPRYKVIADWPGVAGKVVRGDIISSDGASNGFWVAGEPFTEDKLKDYPHLFRKLSWWEYRMPEEMPEYFKIPESEWQGEAVYCVKESGRWGWNEKDAYIFNYNSGGGTLSSYLLPATSQDYTNYLNKKQ